MLHKWKEGDALKNGFNFGEEHCHMAFKWIRLLIYLRIRPWSYLFSSGKRFWPYWMLIIFEIFWRRKNDTVLHIFLWRRECHYLITTVQRVKNYLKSVFHLKRSRSQSSAHIAEKN
jgi:hypothetical protein